MRMINAASATATARLHLGEITKLAVKLMKRQIAIGQVAPHSHAYRARQNFFLRLHCIRGDFTQPMHTLYHLCFGVRCGGGVRPHVVIDYFHIAFVID